MKTALVILSNYVMPGVGTASIRATEVANSRILSKRGIHDGPPGATDRSNNSCISAGYEDMHLSPSPLQRLTPGGVSSTGQRSESQPDRVVLEHIAHVLTEQTLQMRGMHKSDDR